MASSVIPGALSDAAYWDDVYRNGRRPYVFPDVAGNRFHHTLAGLLRRHVCPGSQVLELGCGGLLWLPYLAKVHQCEVTGIDFSAEGLKKAQRHLEQNGVQGTLHELDFFSPPTVLWSSFDFVYSLGVVEHFQDPQRVIGAFCRYLKPRGRLLTWIPNTAGLIMRLQRWADREIYDRHSVLSLDDLIQAHQANGLYVQEAAYCRFLDLSMVNVYRWPLQAYRWWMRLAATVNLPFRWLEQRFALSLQSKWLGASTYVVAEAGTR